MKALPHAHATGECSQADCRARPVHRWRIFTIIAFALMMMAIDSTIVATALHTLQHDLDTSINWAGWTLTAYSFGFVLMLPLSGKLSEQYGNRRVFIASVLAFTVASLLCGLASNIYMLIALRAVQAAGGAGFTPSSTGIVVDHFGDERDRAVSLFGSIFPIGAMIGPIFGGLFVTYWTWRGVFWVNVPIGIAVLVATLRFIPPDAKTRPRHAHLDARGMAWLGSGIIAGMLAASYLAESGGQIDIPIVAALLGVCALGLWMFLRHVQRSPDPLIAPRFIHGRGFGAVNLINGFLGGIPSGMVALIPLYATDHYGIDALRSGTLLIAQGAAAVLLSALAAILIRRTGYRRPLYLGGLITATGMLLLALHPSYDITPYVWLAGAAFLVGAGRGTLNPASRNAGLQLAPHHASTLAALRTMGTQVGAIITIAIVTAVLAGSTDSGGTQAWAYGIAAALLVAALPLVVRVPEHLGAW